MTPRQHPVATLLTQHLQRDLVMGIEDALVTGARRGYLAGNTMHSGHRRSAIGQNRHFHMNEAFSEALQAASAEPTPLRGNRIVVGRSGMFSIGRFHSDSGLKGGSKSQSRRDLSEANKVLERLVTPDLFETERPPAIGSVFFVSVSNPYYNGEEDEDPLSRIEIGVPSADMSGWVFHESTNIFLQRYELATPQEDNVQVVLKKGVAKPLDQGQEK